MTGADVVAQARGWVGTPWCHGAACRGAGADCLGLVRGLWREIRPDEVPSVPPYPPDWAEVGPPDRLVAGLARSLVCCAGRTPAPGDVLVFRLSARGPAKHLGVLTEAGPQARFVHACSGHGVVEAALSAPWRRRIVARFAFPGISTPHAT
ncbi:peptidase [Rhodobaculum claviforme]|uniref:Peptidase n=1 Tax=Rhodobaculum claviforme TaxID=1549854 RepID=A0A934THC6_9RHOB|nr:peptidase [Rhodobaculum claviforme]